MDDEIATWPATRLAEALRTGRVGSRELLELYLDRIERLDGELNAVVTLDADRAREAAGEADEAVARGEALGPLHGLPVTMKDAIEVEGVRSTGGATELADHVPTADAPAVARLRGAGAIVFAKTNTPRWSGDVQTFNDLFGTTNNPWDTSRSPGGSSGGPATAVACGFTSFELGTDIGGSVRIPSHCCGIFGLKPSYGVVPQRGYLDRVGGGTTDVDVNVFGPLARSAEDLELLLSVVAGPPPEQEVAWRLELPAPRHDSLDGMRIAVWIDEPAYPVDAAAAAVLRSAVDAAADAGAHIVETKPPIDMGEQVFLFLLMVGAATAVGLPEEEAQALAGSHLEWLRREMRRAELRDQWARWFADERVDALLCPVMPCPAIAHQHEGTFMERTIEIDGQVRPYADLVAWTGMVGIVGLPAAVPPVGRTAAGLPVGIQVVAPLLHDRTAIRTAGLLAEVAGGYEPPPLSR